MQVGRLARLDDLGWVTLSGSAALRGYQYQFLCTLEYVLQAMTCEDSTVTDFYVESPPPEADSTDEEIVDFALLAGADRVLHAQVKSTLVDENLTAVGVLRILFRLINSGIAEKYVLITSQPPAASANELKAALGNTLSDDALLDKLAELARNSPAISHAVRGLRYDQVARLRRTEIVFDDRELYEVRCSVQRLASSLRKRVNREVGATSGGILTGYLVANVLARAADTTQTPVGIQEMWRHIGADDRTLAQCWGQRDWAPLTGVPARLGDVARPGVMRLIEDALGDPHSDGRGRICVCSGLSGIGKSTIAAQYLADNAHLYDVVHWLDGSSQLALRNSYIAIANHYNLTIASSITDPELTLQVKQALLRTADVWLFVYDNVPSSEGAKSWIPTSGHGHVLITTTQKTGWSGPNIRIVEVPGMSGTEARQLVCARLGLTQDNLNSAQRRGLSFLIDKMEMWPLALELSANYMRECKIPIENPAKYIENLLSRSLNDADSVPIGYPRTLVAAIRLAITELEQRGGESDSAAVAHRVMLFSAFTLPRRIPLHLLLASVIVTPEEAEQQGWRGPLIWRSPRIPIGEIQRELERNCLVKRDEPLRLCPVHVGADGLDAASATIAVNEIVQRLIREDIEKDNETNPVLYLFAYHVNLWVLFLLDGGGLHCGREFLPHAFAVADYALKNQIANYPVALLWGNAANVHSFDERFDAAEEYLSAELEYLRTDGKDPVVEIQTAIALADVLMRKHDSVATATEQALGLIGRATALISKANPDDPTTLVEQVWTARALLMRIKNTQRHDEECLRIRSALEAYTDMLPRLTETPKNALILEIAQHIQNRESEAVKAKALALLEDGSIEQQYKPQFLRFTATACAQLHEWVETLRYIRTFSALVRSRKMHYEDISSLAVDVGIECLIAIMRNNVDAIVVLRSLLRLVDQYELHRRPLHNTDAVCVLVLRALREAAKNRLDLRDYYLDQADFSDLYAENPPQAKCWEQLAQLVSRMHLAEPVTDAILDALPISSHAVEEVRQEPLFESSGWSGLTYDEERGTISVATSPQGAESLWRLHSVDRRRVEGGVIIGPPGSGKTNSLQTIAIEVACIKELLIWFADPSGRHKSSLKFMPGADWIGFDSGEARRILVAAAAVARARHEEGTPYILGEEKPGIIVFLEEGQVVMDPNDSELMDAVEYLATEGPAGGVGLIVTVPDTDLANFGGHRNVRNSLSAVNAMVLRPEGGGPGFIDNLR